MISAVPSASARPSHEDDMAARYPGPGLRKRARASGLAVAASPRPGAVDLDLEREAEHDPDRHDRGEHSDALERRVDDDRPDDVGDDQDLEAGQSEPAGGG